MYRVPIFNLSIQVYRRAPADPTWTPFATHMGQLRAPGRNFVGQTYEEELNPLWLLLLPIGTDVRDPSSGTHPDHVFVPAGSIRRYVVALVDDVAKGFANEYRMAFLRKVRPWTTPYP
jgi:hypothetical protein